MGESYKMLQEMLTAVDKVISAADRFNNAEDFKHDDLIFDSVIMNLVVISEIDQKLSEEQKSKFSEIEWDNFKLFKNKIVSDYYEFDIETVFYVIKEKLPTLRNKLIGILDLK